jgi:hypothetical protein
LIPEIPREELQTVAAEEAKKIPASSQYFDNRLLFTLIICNLLAQVQRGIE